MCLTSAEEALSYQAIAQSPDFAQAHPGADALSNILGTVLNAGFHKALQQIQDQLPRLEQNQERFQAGWQATMPLGQNSLRPRSLSINSLIKPGNLAQSNSKHCNATMLPINCNSIVYTAIVK